MRDRDLCEEILVYCQEELDENITYAYCLKGFLGSFLKGKKDGSKEFNTKVKE